MIYQTFIHLPGVDSRWERRFWEVGVHDWWDFLVLPRLWGLSSKTLSFLKDEIRRHLDHFDDFSYLADLLPAKHHWRLFHPFASRALYLDIETNGLAKERGKVTVIGIFDGQSYQAFVAGHNLQEGLERLAQADFVITFGGSFFDFPFLCYQYPWLARPKVHLDLCPLLRRVGLKGGLKKIEKQLGLSRPEEVDGLDGYQAVKLWRRYQRGDDQALERLILYNQEDVLNLPYLAKIAYRLLKELVLTGQNRTLTVSSEGTFPLRGDHEDQSARF